VAPEEELSEAEHEEQTRGLGSSIQFVECVFSMTPLPGA
jgi:hypothetical protein